VYYFLEFTFILHQHLCHLPTSLTQALWAVEKCR